MWTYRCYDDGSNPNLWKVWYDKSRDFQGSHDAAFRILEQMDNWKPPQAEMVDKPNRIVEVRLQGKIKYRILGFYGSIRKQFVVVLICNHKGKVYNPPDAINTAIRRKDLIEADNTRAKPCVRPTAPD